MRLDRPRHAAHLAFVTLMFSSALWGCGPQDSPSEGTGGMPGTAEGGTRAPRAPVGSAGTGGGSPGSGGTEVVEVLVPVGSRGTGGESPGTGGSLRDGRWDRRRSGRDRREGRFGCDRRRRARDQRAGRFGCDGGSGAGTGGRGGSGGTGGAAAGTGGRGGSGGPAAQGAGPAAARRAVVRARVPASQGSTTGQAAKVRRTLERRRSGPSSAYARRLRSRRCRRCYAWTFSYFGCRNTKTRRHHHERQAPQRLHQGRELTAAASQPQTDGSNQVDRRASGDLPLEVFLQTQDAAAKMLGMDRSDMQWSVTSSDGITRDARDWIDDMFMITGLQVYAYRATKDRKYLDRAVLAMKAYFTKLQQADGLFNHTERSKAYWGRANGWVAAGMTELLLELPPGAIGDAIMAGYRKQMDAPGRRDHWHRPRRLESGAGRDDFEARAVVHGLFHFRSRHRRQEWLVDGSKVRNGRAQRVARDRQANEQLRPARSGLPRHR